MNAIDVATLVLVGTFGVLGLRRGLTLGVVDLVAVAAGLLVAARAYRDVVGPLRERGVPPEVAAPAAFVLLAVAAMLAASLVVGLVLRPLSRLPWPPPLRWLDALFGVVPGAIKGAILAAIVLVPLSFLQGPLGVAGPFNVAEQFAGSRFAGPLVAAGLNGAYEAMERVDLDLGGLATLTARPAGDGIPLPFRVTDGLFADPALEADMLDLVNAERVAAGLAPVRFDEDLAAVGRAHAEEMFRAGYFAHDSPTTGSPSDRLDAAGVPFLVMGENLAYAPTIPFAHAGLMESPGHRANILNPTFTRLGIGVVRSPNRGLMVSQEFAS